MTLLALHRLGSARDFFLMFVASCIAATLVVGLVFFDSPGPGAADRRARKASRATREAESASSSERPE